MKKVLVVDDDMSMHRLFTAHFCMRTNEVAILNARTIDSARWRFNAFPSIDVIVIDACVPGGIPNTMPLVEEFRRTFKGPMIAISTSSEYRKRLLRAGCSHESEKLKAPGLVKELLGLTVLQPTP